MTSEEYLTQEGIFNNVSEVKLNRNRLLIMLEIYA